MSGALPDADFETSSHGTDRPENPAVGAAVSGALESLQVALGSERNSNLIFALVDPALSGDEGSASCALNWPKHRLEIASLPSESRPYLLAFDGSNGAQRVLQHTLELGASEHLGLHDKEDASVRSMAAWLVPDPSLSTQLSAAKMASMLSRFAGWALVPAHTVRFWDPRIAPDFPLTFGDDTWNGFMSALGLRAWYCFHFDGGFSAVGNRNTEGFANEHVPIASWPNDEAALRKLQLIGWRNRILQLGKRWTLIAELTPKAALTVANRALSAGLEDEDDVIRFAFFAFTAHPNFDQHPLVSQSMADGAARYRKTGGFAQHSRTWGEAFIDDLRNGLWADQ